MTSPKPHGHDLSLEQHLIKALQAKPALGRDDMAAMVRQVLDSYVADTAAPDARFFQDIQDMARVIEKAKQDIANLRPKEIGETHIPTATVELDAIVGQTEDATNKIMDECDKISTIAGSIEGENGTQLMDCITRVYEACNFQDLTGQRISKVVAALRSIEEKVAALLGALGGTIATGDGKMHDLRTGDAALLNGPALPGQATSQDDIDRLLSGQ